MQTMTKRQRVMAAICGEEVDRVPLSMWYHLPQYDQDPIALAEEQIRLAKLYNLDLIKMMPFGNYVAQDYGLSVDFFCTKTQAAFERKFGIEDVEEWKRLEPLPATYGTYGKQLQLSQQMRQRVPLVHTSGKFLVDGQLSASLPPEDQELLDEFLRAEYFREQAGHNPAMEETAREAAGA